MVYYIKSLQLPGNETKVEKRVKCKNQDTNILNQNLKLLNKTCEKAIVPVGISPTGSEMEKSTRRVDSNSSPW